MPTIELLAEIEILKDRIAELEETHAAARLRITPFEPYLALDYAVKERNALQFNNAQLRRQITELEARLETAIDMI